jgi:ABC-type phosphate/phosphonate transport system substrate-binding protein
MRAAYNGDDSNRGMNALRHVVAPHARNGRFFASVVRTGSHLRSLRTVAEGCADVAAIDCVTFAFAQDELPALAKRVRAIGVTASAPGLPLIASRALGPERLSRVRDALDAALSADPERARRLRVRGVCAARTQRLRGDRNARTRRDRTRLCDAGLIKTPSIALHRPRDAVRTVAHRRQFRNRPVGRRDYCKSDSPPRQIKTRWPEPATTS